MIVKKDPSTILSYLEDSSNLSGGFAKELVIPQTQDEVGRILKDANNRGCPVTIAGGGTGTSGGRIPFGGIILSTERLNKIKDIIRDNNGGYVVAEAGVLIRDLKDRVEKEGLFYPYDPTEQNAFVGGTIATNASGARSFKYGSTRQSVIGVKIALAQGGILEIERGDVKEQDGKLVFTIGKKEYEIPLPAYTMPRTKNSAGYYATKGMDIVDLFIGQEGTLGCILEARLRLRSKPEDILSCFAFFTNDEDACNFTIDARNMSFSNSQRSIQGIDAMSIEYLDRNTLELLDEKYGNVPSKAKACIFFEQEISRKDEDVILDKWLALLSKHSVSSDNTWVALNDKDRQTLIDKRHAIAESMNEMIRKNNMPKVTTDLAVPHEDFIEMMHLYKQVLSETEIKYFLFGHIGNSHIHMNLLPKTKAEYNTAKKISLKFVEKSVSLGGTVSAEHGIGKMRRDYLKVLYDEKGIQEMINIKKILDPKLILGRGNIFEL